METPTVASVLLREKVRSHQIELEASMPEYGASNLRLFGSVARGDATDQSDLDFLVDIDPQQGNVLMLLAGLSESFHQILGHAVDIVPSQWIKPQVSETALVDAVAI